VITMICRALYWLRHLLTHTETGLDQPNGAWPHTYNDLDPSTKLADPTHGQIDLDIQQHVDDLEPPTLAERTAWENTLQHRRDGGVREWTDPDGRRWKRFADGQVGEDITDLDVGDISELRRIYGPAGIIPDEKLQQWAADVQEDRRRAAEVRERLAAIEAEGLQPIKETGYVPVTGPKAGTSPKYGITMPPKVEDLTTTEWCDLKLEQAYGVGRQIRLPGSSQGFSMRHLNALRNRAEQRDPSLSAYDIAILRSRGLV
jgi:hypothetical protein